VRRKARSEALSVALCGSPLYRPSRINLPRRAEFG